MTLTELIPDGTLRAQVENLLAQMVQTAVAPKETELAAKEEARVAAETAKSAAEAKHLALLALADADDLAKIKEEAAKQKLTDDERRIEELKEELRKLGVEVGIKAEKAAK